MAVAKEIKSKIASVKNTRKITSAMEMVAASKMRKAQERMNASRPYANTIRNVISHVARGCLEYKHPYMNERAVKKVGYILVSTDRGLCGGLNVNLFKRLSLDIKGWAEKSVAVEFAALGSRGAQFLDQYGGSLKAHNSGLGDAPQLTDVLGTAKVMLDLYESGGLDKLYIVYNKFVNTMKQEPVIETLLPLPKTNDEKLMHQWDYIYEPDAQELLTKMLKRYVEAQVYQGVVENVASEQAARMVAMKSATDNAGELVKELQLVYNKARQAAITQELSEIVGGASAV